MADFSNITSADLARVAVPARRAFTNPDGSPSFRLMLAHVRDEVAEWRDRNRREAYSGQAYRKLGAFNLRTIAGKFRHLAEREELATGWHPLRAAADAYDAIAKERNLQADDTSRAFAILALAADRPALSTRCHNGCVLMDWLNTGRSSAADLAASPLALAGTVALNAAGERLLAEARALAAPAIALAA